MVFSGVGRLAERKQYFLKMACFVDVILPLQLAKPLTYAVPENMVKDACIGKRVIVGLKKSKLYAGIICQIHNNIPEDYQARNIESIIDELPIVNEIQLQLWRWMADYYMCTIGEIMHAAMPGGLKLSSETAYVLNPEKTIDHNELNDQEYLVIEALEIKKVLKEEHIHAILSGKRVHSTIKQLLEKKAILIQEEIRQKFKPKTETYVRLSAWADDEEQLKLIFDKLSRAEKQLNTLMGFIHLSKRYSTDRSEVKKINLEEAAKTNSGIISQLVKKNIFELYEKEIGGDTDKNLNTNKQILLSENQQKALQKIIADFEKNDVCLLHGVTSSGKTEIYFKLIEEVIKKGQQVLYLLPEIALTAQMINRLKAHFGENVGVYHSRFNENERVDLWNNVLKEKRYNIILGARSSVFLPYSNIGLIIADEEHDASYKQQDPAPRYNGRDVAIVLGKLHKAKVLLGSATPSLESYFKALHNKYGFTQLNERFGNAQLPQIKIVDVKDESNRKKMKANFTSVLVDEMDLALKNKEQIILFQNRRGYVPVHQCYHCGHVPMCAHCDVSLTYHKMQNVLKCHYCGYTETTHKNCKKCNSTDIRTKGFGTEKIEEDLKLIFPEAKVARMDLDTTRSKYAFSKLIHEFENKEIDILIGTQMVTKGLDFENVTVVGILNADSALNYPDFRAFERSFQQLMQVSGRAGRKDKIGKVIIQTMQPHHEVLKYVTDSSYSNLFEKEIKEREDFNYPPFCRLIEITLKHNDSGLLNTAADYLGAELRKIFGNRILGPEYPVISKIRNQYHKRLLLKIENEKSVNKAKQMLYDVLNAFKLFHKNIQIIVDVDPS